MIDDYINYDIPQNYVQPMDMQPPIEQEQIVTPPDLVTVPVQSVQRPIVQPVVQVPVQQPVAQPQQGQIIDVNAQAQQPSLYQQRWQQFKKDTGSDPVQGMDFGPTEIKPVSTSRNLTYGEGEARPNDLVQLPEYLRKLQEQQAAMTKPQEKSEAQKEIDRIKSMIRSGTETQKKALDEKGRVYEELKKNIGAVYDDEINQVKKLRDGYKDEQGKIVEGFNQRFTDLMRDLDKEYAQVENQKIDNNRMFNNMGTGRRILVGIGLFMSAFNQKSMDNSVKIINDAIDRDIRAQQLDLQNKKYGIAGKQNKLDLLIKKYGSDVSGINALALLQKRKVIAEIDAKINKANTQQEKGKLELLKAQMLSSLKKNVQNFSKFQLQEIATQRLMKNADPIQRIILDNTSGSPTERKAAIADLEKFRGEQGSYRQASSVYNDMLKASLEDALASKLPYTKSRVDQLAAFAELFGPFKTFIKEAVTKGELEVLEPFVPKVDDTPAQIRARRDKFLRALVNGFGEKVNANMVLPHGMKLRHSHIIEKEPKL